MIWLEQLPPILTIKQIERLANIFDNAGQVVFGAVVISPLVSVIASGGVDRADFKVLILGLVTTLFCWLFSLILERKRR